MTTPVAVGTISPDSPTSEASGPTLTETFRPDVTQELGKPEVCRPTDRSPGVLPYPFHTLARSHAPSLPFSFSSPWTLLTASLYLTLAG